MSRKTLPGILLAASVLITACLCCPTFSLPALWDLAPATAVPWSQPATEAPAIPTETDSSATDVSVCLQSLPLLLEESENGLEDSISQGEITLVTYSVSGDSIFSPEYESVPGNLHTYQQDVTAQADIWRFFTDVIPAEQRTMVRNYVVYTDGIGGSLGAVEQTDNPAAWMFEMDIADGANFADLSTTVVHEFAHLLTLNQSQVETDISVFYNPDDEDLYSQAEASCSTYFMFEGCSRADSYINEFFQRFWPDIYAEWEDINAEENDDRYNTRLDAFYIEYADQFVSDYAVTDPSEDLAETFMYFVFSPLPAGNTIAEQKIQFFYDYPELVELRGRILSSLCPYVEGR